MCLYFRVDNWTIRVDNFNIIGALRGLLIIIIIIFYFFPSKLWNAPLIKVVIQLQKCEVVTYVS